MKTLSMIGFGKFCAEISPVSFIFDSENQDNDLGMGLGMVSRYSEVIYTLSPNQIYFKNDFGFLRLSGVKEIYLEEDQSVGYVFKIICKDYFGLSGDRSYTILADKNK